MLRIRTNREMIHLNDEESAELRDRLRRYPAAQTVEETIAVSANASTSITFTNLQKLTVLEVLNRWLDEAGREAMGAGPARLRDILADEHER